MKNQNAVALGKLAKGKEKTGLTPAELNRRRELAIKNRSKLIAGLAKWREKEAKKRAALRGENKPVEK